MDEGLDLSLDELSEVAEELEPVEDLDTALEESAEADEDIAGDIAQAIEDAAGEEEDVIDKEIEAALDISDPEEDDDDDDDDDEEFNLEDFDIGEIDESPSDKK
jgi:hypothetical protein